MLFWVILHRPCPIWRVSQPSNSIHTTQQPSHMLPHWLCHMQFLQGTGSVQVHIAPIFSVTTPCSQLLYTQTYPNCISKMRLGTVTLLGTSTGDCHAQVFLTSLTGEDIDLFSKTSPLTLYNWSNGHSTCCLQTGCIRFVTSDLGSSWWGWTGTPSFNLLWFLYTSCQAAICCWIWEKYQQQKQKESTHRLNIDRKTLIWSYRLLEILHVSSACCWPPCLLLCG